MKTTSSQQWPLLHFLCFIVMACFQVGCATIETRLGSSPGDIESIFPSTRRAQQRLEEMTHKDDLQNIDEGGAMVLGYFLGAYSFVEVFPAVVSDVFLLPMDSYILRKKSAKERQVSEQYSKGLRVREQ